MTKNSLSEFVISNDNLFVDNLNRLKEFSRQLPRETNLPTVPTEGGLFGWFDHKVTGDELNNLTKNIQNEIIKQNITLEKILKEFPKIYDTFSELDKDYIKKIIISISAASKALDDVIFANERIDRQQNEINDDHQDIKQVINQQKQIIQVLNNFKEKLEKLEHLYDIDNIFSNIKNFQIRIEILEQISAEQKVSIEKFSERQMDFERSISKLKELNNELSLKLTQSTAETEQRFSEIEKDIEKNHKEHIDKYNSIEVTLASVEQSIQDAYSKTNDKIEQASKEANDKYEAIQNDLAKLRYENGVLSKSLIVARIIPAIGLLFLFVIVILFLTGVIK